MKTFIQACHLIVEKFAIRHIWFWQQGKGAKRDLLSFFVCADAQDKFPGGQWCRHSKCQLVPNCIQRLSEKNPWWMETSQTQLDAVNLQMLNQQTQFYGQNPRQIIGCRFPLLYRCALFLFRCVYKTAGLVAWDYLVLLLPWAMVFLYNMILASENVMACNPLINVLPLTPHHKLGQEKLKNFLLTDCFSLCL